MNSITKTLLGLALSSLAAVAHAVPINGSFGFGGTFAPLGGTAANTATGIDFTTPTGRIGTCSGSYASIFAVCNSVTGDPVTVGDIPVGTLPASGAVAISIGDWITTATLGFDLTGITSIVRDATGLTSLTINGHRNRAHKCGGLRRYEWNVHSYIQRQRTRTVHVQQLGDDDRRRPGAAARLRCLVLASLVWA